MSKVRTHRFRNSTSKPIALMIEPWAIVYDLASQSWAQISVIGEETVEGSSHFELVDDCLLFRCEGEGYSVEIDGKEVT